MERNTYRIIWMNTPLVTKYNNLYTHKVTLIGNTANIVPFHVLWPIPSNVILANTLGHINQNIGYGGAESNISPLTTPIRKI